MYIDTVTGDYPLTADDIKSRLPNTLFSHPFIPPVGYAEVLQTPMPEWKPAIEHCIEGAPEFTQGVWKRTWIIEKLYSDPSAEAAALAAHEAKALQAWREQTTCTPFQGKAALFQAGLLDDIEALVANAATDTLTKLAWANAVEWKRNSPMITSLATALNMADTQVDDLFKAASQIVA
jgi:hypothetical protein